MERQLVTTADGSTTIRLPEWDECYHSTHGAIQEASHVFIKNGLSLTAQNVSILEIGFGTGLNALVTLKYAVENAKTVRYTGVEGFPVDYEMALSMNFPELLGAGFLVGAFERMHKTAWNAPGNITESFSLEKKLMMFDQIDEVESYDLIYFDAFGYNTQPELWSEEIFTRMFLALKPGGILVTYAARSVIKRNMQAAGFVVEKLAGPPGKREMMRALKK